MKKIDTKNCLCVYDEGELRSVYIITGTVNDVERALRDSGYFDYDKEDWADGIEGYCSLKEIAKCILKNYEFEIDDIFIGINGHTP
jgi:hypothetical protein